MGNSEQKKENNKPKEDENSNFICNLLKGAVGVFIVVILLFVGINIWGGKFFNEENTTLSNLGTIGDYFGGLINPLLGFVSFCALLYTIRIQMQSLAKQSEELELTREELKATKEELARSAKAQEQSSAIFKQQQFEATFFSLLNQIIISIDNFHKSNMKQRYDSIYYNCMELISQKELKFAWEEINRNGDSLPKTFILIYQLLKLIDRYESDLSNNKSIGKEKAYEIAKSYGNILRSCLDRNFLQLFAINGCRTDFNNMDIYKGYIEKYSLLEHMSFSPYHTSNTNSRENILEELVGFYSPKAFDKSDAYKELMEKKNSQQQIS